MSILTRISVPFGLVEKSSHEQSSKAKFSWHACDTGGGKISSFFATICATGVSCATARATVVTRGVAQLCHGDGTAVTRS